MHSISIILPAYNEAENIKKTVAQAAAYLEDKNFDYEVIVVNDGSHDNTPDIVTKLARANPKIILINHNKNMGYGAALRSGFDRALKDFIFLTDSDGQFEISDLDRFLPLIATHDVVIGYRQKRADPFNRWLVAKGYQIFINALFGLHVKDIDCAFKLFCRQAYLAVRPIQSGGALFSAELLIRFKQKGFSIAELPVRHFPRRFGKQKGANIFVILRVLKECWKLRKELSD